MVQLGDMLLQGKGQKDAAQGITLLEKAADAGLYEISNRALNIIAFSFLPGGALPQNIEKAQTYALRAAAHCDPIGMLAMSFSFDQPSTLVYSYAWANAASQHGKDKQQQLAIKTRNDLEQRMDPASIARAQALTNSFPVCRAG
jgi:TPR repeat protein